MNILVNRLLENGKTTLSHISVDNEFVCFGLEDPHRVSKIKGKTRIPCGKYSVGLRKVGGFHSRYKKRFKDFHEGMLHVKDVHNFKYILIHVGNTNKDTDGCLLVGNGCLVNKDYSIIRSVLAYKKLYKKVINDAKKGSLTIEYLDNDRYNI